jgi:hypothetical protein
MKCIPFLVNIVSLCNLRPGSISNLEDLCMDFVWLSKDCSAMTPGDKKTIHEMEVVVAADRAF